MTIRALLETRGVSKHFGGLKAISDVSFDIRQGEIFSVIGPNGAGKTTLFNLITGFLAPTRGEIYFQGEKISGLKPYQVARKSLGRTFLNGMFGWRGKRAAENKTLERAHQLSETIGLGREKDTVAGLLPQRAQKQLSIGLALASEPELLLLDEPAGGVGTGEVGMIIELISRIRDAGTTICLIEHKMSMVMNISDRILALNYGKKVTEGIPAEVCQNEEVIKSYLGEKYAASRRAC